MGEEQQQGHPNNQIVCLKVKDTETKQTPQRDNFIS